MGRTKPSTDRPNKKANRPGDTRWIRNNREERHLGSYPLEELKASEAYSRRIVQENALCAKRKYALCISYLGTKYQGLQINPGAETVERELERALFLAGGIIEANYGFMQKVQWTRAARTDRGVHAITQCCAIKLLVPIEGRALFIQQVNSFLPDDVTLQTLTKVTKGFNAKGHCTRREYHYMLPSFVVMPVHEANAALTEAFTRQGPVVGAGYEGGFVDPHSSRSLGRQHIESLRPHFASFRINPEQLATLRSALATYEGTHSYHNFTTGKDASEANSKRYMTSFTAATPFVDPASGVEWILLSVLGQSFLFNQIRKMVAVAVDITRGAAAQGSLELAFTAERMDVPLAPALGLYLNQVFFDGHNSKQRRETDRDQKIAADKVAAKEEDEEEDGDDPAKREEIDWYADEAVKANLEAFRTDKLLPHIFKEEAASLSFIYYLDYCRAHPHPYTPRGPSVKHSGPAIETEDGNESS